VDLTPFIIIISIVTILATVALPILAVVISVRRLGTPPDAEQPGDSKP
jgi:Tfp pilus assembly protein FimT